MLETRQIKLFPLLSHSSVCTIIILSFFVATAEAKPISAARDEVVRETMQYLNVPYLWGGMHPRTGMDCSAFVRLVYQKAGLHLPRVSRDQFAASMRLKPSEVLPGDIIFFAMKKPSSKKVDHVGIYVGKGFFVHASFTNGIHIDSIANPYYFQRMVGIRKYRGFSQYLSPENLKR